MLNLFKQPKYTSGPSRNEILANNFEFIDVANDLHYGSEFQDNPDVPEIILSMKPDKKTYAIGDIFDRSCCPKSRVESLTIEMSDFIIKMGDAYVYGNHERAGINHSHIIHQLRSGKKVYLTHGDLESDPEKWIDYRMKKELGASKLGLLRVKLFDNMDWIKANIFYNKLPKGFLERAAAKAKAFHCDYYVCGHFHVTSERRYNVNGVTIILLPAHKLNRVWL